MNIERILLATDFSTWARRAEEDACSLAASWRAHLTVLAVLEFPPGLNPEYPVNRMYLEDRMRETSGQLAEYQQRAARLGLEVSTRIATGLPSEEINAAARGEDADLIVLGTRGKSGLAHVLLGSTAERVIRTAPCPVITVHSAKDDGSAEGTGLSLSRILVPIDFSDCSLDALEYAALVAKKAEAAIELVHVLEPVSYGLDFTLGRSEERDRTRDRITARLRDLSAALSTRGISASSHLRGGVPADSILDDVQTSPCDLIVMGTHGRRGLSHFMAGSVTEAVLRRTSCPVLTVRSPKFAAGRSRAAPASTAQSPNP